MGFLIQWVVYLVAFAAGSTVAYAIATAMIKKTTEQDENETSDAEIGSAESAAEVEFAEAPTLAFEPHVSESEIGAQG